MSRTATINRQTAETQIELTLNLDGTGQAQVATGVGFFDHMLTLLAKHGAFDLTVRAAGDLHIDQHHTVEDVGICFGQALRQALGDKAGIRRYGHFTLPMEETLATAAVDLSGRYFLVFDAGFTSAKIGDFDTELVEDFWQAAAANGLFNLHIQVHYGRNNHHRSEAIYKATALALRMAVEVDGRLTGIPSTKGRWARNAGWLFRLARPRLLISALVPLGHPASAPPAQRLRPCTPRLFSPDRCIAGVGRRRRGNLQA